MTIETINYPGRTLQPGRVAMQVDLLGTGATAPTAVASKDNDNRLVSSVTRSGIGVYVVNLSQYDRVLLAVDPSFEAAANNYQIGGYTYSAGTLTIRVFTAAGAAADLAVGDKLHLELKWKHGG